MRFLQIHADHAPDHDDDDADQERPTYVQFASHREVRRCRRVSLRADLRGLRFQVIQRLLLVVVVGGELAVAFVGLSRRKSRALSAIRRTAIRRVQIKYSP